MELNRDNLLKAIKKKPLLIHECSMCNYPCTFQFVGSQLAYDSGCDCTRHWGGLTARNPEELDFYLDPTHGWIETLQKFVEENAI
jgi:hypothetical protein